MDSEQEHQFDKDLESFTQRPEWFSYFSKPALELLIERTHQRIEKNDGYSSVSAFEITFNELVASGGIAKLRAAPDLSEDEPFILRRGVSPNSICNGPTPLPARASLPSRRRQTVRHRCRMTENHMDSRVRIRITHDGVVGYLSRFADGEENNGIIFQSPETVPYDNIKSAYLLSRDDAVHTCKILRARGWEARIVNQRGMVLFEDETAPPIPTPPTPERIPMTVPGSGILIVPVNPRGWYVRFPNTPFESIFADTAAAAYQKLIEEYPSRIPHAEKCPMEPEPFPQPQLQQPQPQSRLRPGSR